jgi:hypothetical protein
MPGPIAARPRFDGGIDDHMAARGRRLGGEDAVDDLRDGGLDEVLEIHAGSLAVMTSIS